MNLVEIIAALTVKRYSVRPKSTPIPDANWDEEPTICLNVNEEWASHIIGLLEALDQADTWEGTPEEIEAARENARHIILGFMEGCDEMIACCPEPNRTRINDDGTMEISYDGGLTWQSGDDDDPRITAPQFPPLTGSPSDQKRCDAAANVEFHFEAHAEQIENDTTLWATISGLVGAFVSLLIFLSAITLGTLTPIVMGIAAALLTVGKDAFTAAMTAEVWATFNCIIYCRMDDNGNLTGSDIDGIVSDINAQLTGVAALYLSKTVLFMGVVGMNNMARTATGVEGNCVDCECPETCPQRWHPRFDDPSLGVITEVGDDYIIAETTTAQPNGVYYISLWTDDAADPNNCCYITSVEVLTGSASVNIGSPCGDGGTARPLLLPNCLWWIEPQSSIPFSVKITISDCP